MKCPKCGYPRAKYTDSRRQLWKGRMNFSDRSSSKPRTNFEIHCPKCGFKGEYRSYLEKIIPTPEEKEETENVA